MMNEFVDPEKENIPAEDTVDVEATDTTDRVCDRTDNVEETTSEDSQKDVAGCKEGDDSLEGGLEAEEYQTDQKKYWIIKAAFCAIGLIAGFVICFIEMGGDRKINQALSIAIWMATLWLTEIIPLVVTAFTPIVLFPLFGIVSSKDITAQYANSTIFLFISGFLMALSLQRWNLHRRFSLKLLTWCGVRPQLLLLGIMSGTFFLSMFVSNTATSLMMVPNALSVCRSLEESSTGQDRRDSRRFATAILLGIAYSANVGGMASLLGTPPNLVFQKQLALIFPEAPEMTFAIWLGFGIPIALIMLFFVWTYLSFVYLRNLDLGTIDNDIFKNQYEALGSWSREQIIVSILFVAEALLWIFRKDLEFENVTIKGWANIFPDPSAIADATVGMGIAILLFLCPGQGKNMAEDAPGYESETVSPTSRTTLLDWKTANTVNAAMMAFDEENICQLALMYLYCFPPFRCPTISFFFLVEGSPWPKVLLTAVFLLGWAKS